MQIKEACALCGITKKAAQYYEAKGLVSPQILENGYRDYSGKEIMVLKEISVLRRLDIPIAEIKNILSSSNKSAELEKYKYLSQIKLQKIEQTTKYMDSMIAQYDVNRQFENLSKLEENAYTIKERLVFAFPGSFGLYMSLHFGAFLDEPIDTQEKRDACNAIIGYLDSAEINLPPDAASLLKSFDFSDTTRLQAQISDSMTFALDNTERYIEENKDEIEAYLAFKASEEYKNSQACQMQQSLLDFQQKSGYEEIFIKNMKILSKSYSLYISHLDQANKRFLESFPQSK